MPQRIENSKILDRQKRKEVDNEGDSELVTEKVDSHVDSLIRMGTF